MRRTSNKIDPYRRRPTMPIRHAKRERAAERDLEDGVVEAAEVDYDSGVYDSHRLLASLEDRDDVDVDRLDRDLDTARDDWDRFVADQEGN